MQHWEYCYITRTTHDHGTPPEVFLTKLKRNNGSSHLVPIGDFNEQVALLGEEGWEMVVGVPAPAFISLEFDVNVGSESIWFKRPLPEKA